MSYAVRRGVVVPVQVTSPGANAERPAVSLLSGAEGTVALTRSFRGHSSVCRGGLGVASLVIIARWLVGHRARWIWLRRWLHWRLRLSSTSTLGYHSPWPLSCFSVNTPPVIAPGSNLDNRPPGNRPTSTPASSVFVPVPHALSTILLLLSPALFSPYIHIHPSQLPQNAAHRSQSHLLHPLSVNSKHHNMSLGRIITL
jgi:hypothetical protein